MEAYSILSDIENYNLIPTPNDYFDEQEFEITNTTPSDQQFDEVVGLLEDIVSSDEFASLQQNFILAHCQDFSAFDELSHNTFAIFNSYQTLLEGFIRNIIGGDVLSHFCEILPNRQEEIDGPLFELLLSFSDFQQFREIMVNAQSGCGLMIAGTASRIYNEEMEDGDARPDLNGLCISSIGY